MNDLGIHKNQLPVNVLIVDDKKENIFSLQQLLEDADENIVYLHASSGNEALKIVFREEIALILLDVQMPEMDGYEVSAILKNNRKTQHIPIIFVTAVNQEHKYITEGYTRGAVDFLFKPLNPTITKAKVKAFVSLYRDQKSLENAYKNLEHIVDIRTSDLKSKNDELQRIKEELECKNDSLMSLNRDLDQFVYIASHDFKLPLANFEGLLNALSDNMEEGEHNSENIMQMMYASVFQMRDTISGLLEVIKTKSQYDVLEIIDCLPTIELVKYSISGFIKSNGAEIYSDISDCPRLYFNRAAFKSILYNLLTNSIKYHHPERKPVIKIRMYNEADCCVLSVKDNGIGMSDEELSGLFKLFSRVNPNTSVEGTGMGLFNLKNLLTKYGAQVKVISIKHIGSEFKIYFGPNVLKHQNDIVHFSESVAIAK